MTETCGTCRYLKAPVEAGSLGLCQRYPIPARKGAGDWCGEFEARATASAPNVVEMPTPKKQPRKKRRSRA